jgi:hypothetical protein
MKTHFRRILLSALAGAALAALAAPASAQLRPEQVLVIYDSRIPDSKAVAEYYAGSAAIPGASESRPGTRPGVRVFDLASTGLTPMTQPDIDRPIFKARLRDPLRNWLTANDPRGDIRCLVMTRGLPFRLVNDVAPAFVGDNPGAAGNAFVNGQYSAASVDSEMTVLFQNLDVSSSGAALPYANGAIINPYWPGTFSRGQASVVFTAAPVNGWSTARRTAQRTFSILGSGLGAGVYWGANLLNTPNSTATPTATVLTPGDVFLVSRLDAKTLAGTRAMLDRAVNIRLDVDTVGFVVDEANSDGLANTSDNGEFDNSAYPGGITSPGYGGDDYEQTLNTIANDGRYLIANVTYNAFANRSQFTVGPNRYYRGEGLLVTRPIALLTHFGANHQGDAPAEGLTASVPPEQPLDNSRNTYEESFILANGAAMNTMESYNGRAFGGYEPSFGQGSIADFLENGGTFALGNVWEPFSMTVPDSAQLVRHFYLGNLSWGEAAFASMPFISFQQMVLGDPLARIVRSSEDRDGNGRVDIEDLYAYEAAPADLNRTGGVTEADRAFMINAARSGRENDLRGLQRP